MNVAEEVERSLMRQRSTAADGSTHRIKTVKPALTCVCSIRLKADAPRSVFGLQAVKSQTFPSLFIIFKCICLHNEKVFCRLTGCLNYRFWNHTTAVAHFNWMKICGLRDLRVNGFHHAWIPKQSSEAQRAEVKHQHHQGQSFSPDICTNATAR